MCDGSEKKVKRIAFMSNTKEEEEESGQDVNEDLANDVALLGRQFNKLLKKMDVRSKSNVKNISSDISKSNNVGRRTRSDEKSKEGKGVQCHECDGYGHIRAECGTYLKKQKKSLVATWSDESEIEESQDISNMRVDELIGSLQTFELGMSDGSEKKAKSIALCQTLKRKRKKVVKILMKVWKIM